MTNHSATSGELFLQRFERYGTRALLTTTGIVALAAGFVGPGWWEASQIGVYGLAMTGLFKMTSMSLVRRLQSATNYAKVLQPAHMQLNPVRHLPITNAALQQAKHDTWHMAALATTSTLGTGLITTINFLNSGWNTETTLWGVATFGLAATGSLFSAARHANYLVLRARQAPAKSPTHG